MKKLQLLLILIVCLSPIICVSAPKEKGELKEHLSIYDTFFGNEEDHQVCYPKDHRNLFYWIIFSAVASSLLLGSIIYIKVKNNRTLKLKNAIIHEKNQELLDSITYAKRIQSALLPSASYLQSLEHDCEVIYYPRDIVSGDLYWVFTENDTTYFAVIDCTGHGVPGAFLSLLAHNSINKAVIEMGLTDPAAILKEMDAYVRHVLNQSAAEELKDGMEIGLCVINQHQVRYAGANIRLLCLQKQQLHEMRGSKSTIGSLHHTVNQVPLTQELNLSIGDRLYMFTDGVVDQFGGPRNKKFSSKRLKEVVQNTSNLTLMDQRKEIDHYFHSWKKTEEQTDDVLLMAIELK